MKEILIRRNTVLEALRGSRREIFTLWLQEGLDKKLAQPVREAAQQRRVPIQTADKQKIGRLAKDASHQGIALEVGPYVYSEVDEILGLAEQRGEKPFLLLLDLLHGPQNIGALLRTAEICGVHGVIVSSPPGRGHSPNSPTGRGLLRDWLAVRYSVCSRRWAQHVAPLRQTAPRPMGVKILL